MSRDAKVFREECSALVPLFKAASECAQRWGWDEDRLVCLLRVCWGWVRTGTISALDEPLAVDGGELSACEQPTSML
jgi:hypothetical protein